MPKTKTYSLYLLKEEVVDFTNCFTDTAVEDIKGGHVSLSEQDDFGSGAQLYIFRGHPRPPSWLTDVRSVFHDVPAVENRSSSAVMLFKHCGRIFANTFAHGWQYLDERKLEADFGLKVTINSLKESEVKRVDSNHLGEAIKGVAQSATQRELQAFGIDEALELIRKISGRLNNNEFADNLSGATSLKFTRTMEYQEMLDVAEQALERFNSTDYESTSFSIINKVRPILDKNTTDELDDIAVNIIKGGQPTFELAMPGWFDDDVIYYGFYGSRQREKYPDLLMRNYVEVLGDEINELDREKISTTHGVVAELGNDSSVKKRWSIKKALVGSVIRDDGRFAASEGQWYRVDQLFKTEVDMSFAATIKDWENAPLAIITKVNADGKKSGLETELSYNERCAVEYGQLCLDQKDIMVPEVPYGKFESCDLLDIEGKRLIHVKKSSRQSSVLSHFFKQGANSASILKLYPQAKFNLISKIDELFGNDTAEAARNGFDEDFQGWTIEFHMVDSPRADGTFTIPFFSRVSLREEAMRLRAMGFEVVTRFIPN